jgi:GTPase KRas protein
VLIFDITNQASFTAIDDFKDQILRVKDEDRYPMVLVGSRADKQGERVVSFADANKYAMSIGTTYLEVDLTNGTGVDEVFSESARKVAQFNRPPAAYKKPAPKK